MNISTFPLLPDDLTDRGLKLLTRLSPLLLVWPAMRLSESLWNTHVLALTPRPSMAFDVAYYEWGMVTLTAPILVMLAAVAFDRTRYGSSLMAIVSILALALGIVLLMRPEWRRMSLMLRYSTPFETWSTVNRSVVYGFCVGFMALGWGIGLYRDGRLARQRRRQGQRAQSDNHGHAQWLSMNAARRLFSGPDPVHGGVVIGEAYRVDRDRRIPRFEGRPRDMDPDDRRTWGQGGKAPLLIDHCRKGSTHGLVVAGSGGYKTQSVAIPTLLYWKTSAVVLDPSRELGPKTAAYRQRALGHRAVMLDPTRANGDGFNVLDFIDPSALDMGANVELVATWLVGEAAGANGMVGGGGEFFRDMGKSLIMAILADILSDEDPRAERTLRRLRKVLVTPEEEMRQVLRRIHANSASAFARDKAGTLMGLVAETFSGVYANAAQATQWLSNAAYADLVSGDSFRSSDLRGGRLTIYIQIPLKTLQATPGVARVVLGALLNAICEADGDVEGRALFLLDEVARLGPMGALEAARDTIRKSKATLVLLYQSVGQIEKQWGAEGKTAWYASASWRIYAGVSDQTTLKELSEACGAHGVVASSQGDTAGVSGRGVGSNQTSSGRSENYSEMGRALIKGDELLQDTRADEAFVIVRGSRPLRCGRAIFFRRREMIAQVEAAVRPS